MKGGPVYDASDPGSRACGALSIWPPLRSIVLTAALRAAAPVYSATPQAGRPSGPRAAWLVSRHSEDLREKQKSANIQSLIVKILYMARFSQN
jgi:hypothetical protein